MLERIAEIKGIGLLHDANGKSHTCQKATFIYADNGRGKSTLASVMRSVSTNAAALISNRKTIDGTLAPQVELQFGSGHKVTFNGAGWSEHRPDVIVFDSDFIEQNVHSGGSVTTGQRKNLLDFALGDAAVNARRDVETATASAKSANEKMQTITAQLEGYRGTLLLTQFESLPPNPNAPAELTDIQTRITAATNVAAIQSKPVPSQTDIPEFDIDGIFDDLSVSLEDIHAGAEAVVKAHVAGLHNKAAESWISEGRKFEDSVNCPYCGQDTSSNDLIGAYAPSDAHYWMHGHSTERDFIYVTTANLNHEQLQQLADEVGAERSLLVLCTAFRGRGEYPNLTVKKIPKQVLSRCEWGHDDYSLQVENLPKAPLPSPLPQAGEGTKAKGRNANVAQGGLFEEGEA